MLQDLKEAATPPEKENGRNNSWISQETWRLIDRKASARRSANREQLRPLKVLVRRALKRDRTARANAAAVEDQAHLEAGDIWKAFGSIKGWYREAGPQPIKPPREDIEVTRLEQAALHAPRETPHDPIPVHIEPFAVDDGPPTEEEVAEAVRKLKNRKAAGATGIKAEHLKSWLREARPEGDVEPAPSAITLWEKMLELVQLVFVEGEISCIQ